MQGRAEPGQPQAAADAVPRRVHAASRLDEPPAPRRVVARRDDLQLAYRPYSTGGGGHRSVLAAMRLPGVGLSEPVVLRRAGQQVAGGCCCCEPDDGGPEEGGANLRPGPKGPMT